MYRPAEYTSSCEKALDEISVKAQERLKDCGINAHVPAVPFTTASTYLEEVAGYLRHHPDEEVEIPKVMKFWIDVSSSEKGEKAGNIVPCAEAYISSIDFSKDFREDMEKNWPPNNVIETISSRTLTRVKNENGIDLRKEYVPHLIALVFLYSVIHYVQENTEEEVTLSSLVKFQMAKGKDAILLELGEKFKLGVKNDAMTEEEEEDE